MECPKKNKMKNKILIVTLLLFSMSVYSQKNNTVSQQYVDSINSSIELKLSKEIMNQTVSVSNDIFEFNKSLMAKIDSSEYKTEKLRIEIENLSEKTNSLLTLNNDLNIRFTELLEKYNSNLNDKILNIIEITDSLGNRAKILNDDLLNSNSKIFKNSNELITTNSNLNEVSEDLADKGQFGIISILIALFLILIVYLFLNKKWNNETKKLSVKQKEVLEKQIEDSQKLADWLSNKNSEELLLKSSETDHSFAKRVADEIVRISTNLSRMDDSIRGFKQLSASVRKLIQSLSINEYEIVELLNKPYTSGMNLEANFVINEDIDKGSQIITRIIKPQINFKGKMIQAAQVEVSQND